MSRNYSYLNSAIKIIQEYKGLQPFATFLKSFFSEHKKFGSGDRKQVSHICYCYFRTARAFAELSPEDRILSGYFLCSSEPNEFLAALNPAWNERTRFSLEEKLKSLGEKHSFDDFFPGEKLSDTINKETFIHSLFQQPDLFLRLRPGQEEVVKNKLKTAGIEFNEMSSSCLALPNASKIDKIIELDKEAVVQDYSSQQTGSFLLGTGRSFSQAWDCCAGSGGKSIMLYDLFPNIELTVSDKRPSILQNLADRFYTAGIKKYKCVKADLSLPGSKINDTFDLVLADVPCTGSGTWGRSPEQLYFFNEKKVDEYVSLQRRIISNVHGRLEKGGLLFYITCSVFAKENEEMIEWINGETGLQTVKMEILKGYQAKADTMFAAILEKPL